MARTTKCAPVQETNSEGGYVLALFSVSLLGLILMIGFAVDLGSWYLSAARMQRAADLASLSAAVALPDSSAASAKATDSLKRNGFTNGVGAITTAVTTDATSVKVSVRNGAVPTYFLNILFPSISIGRDARAERSSSIPLGNPFNVFGYGDNRLGLSGDVDPQGFWAAINGQCDPKEDGDFFQALRDGNKLAAPGNRHLCGPANGTNPDYDPGGYNYLVEVPTGANNVSIRVFGGMFALAGQSPDIQTLLPNDVIGPADWAYLETVYSVTKVMGVVPAAGDPNVGLLNGTRFMPGIPVDPGTGSCHQCWYPIATGLSPGTYRVSVSNPVNSSKSSVGFNIYSIMASETSRINTACDSRTDMKCPRVSGYGAVSTYNDDNNDQADYYLADISPGFAGAPFDAYMWDPGEGMDSIELLDPNGTVIPFTYTVAPVVGTEPGGGPTTKLIVSGTAPATGPNILGTGKFNDRLVTLHFTVPAYVPSNNNQWFKIRYKSGTGTVTDRITFGVSASTNSPIRLSNNNPS